MKERERVEGKGWREKIYKKKRRETRSNFIH